MARTVKKRKGVVEQVKATASDVAYGVGELKRQAGAAVNTIKERARKIKKFTR